MFEAQYGYGQNRWHVLRLRAGSKSEVVLLSSAFFSLTTHFHGRTIPCSGDGCALCELLPARGLFYVAVACAGQVMLLELGAQSASYFEQHAKLLHGGMRPGLVFELSRRGAKAPVVSEVVREQLGVVGVEKLILCQRALALYKFPPCNPGDSIEVYEGRVAAIARRRNELLAKQILASPRAGV